MILRLIEEGIAAGIGTIAFALMFHVPKQYYLCGGVAGAAGWLVYRALAVSYTHLPRACEHLAETAERLALAEDYLAGQAREAAKRLAGRKTDGGAGLFLDREGFLQEPEALKAYILRYCLREVSEKFVLRGESLQDQEGTFRQQEPGVSLYNISSSHLSAITELASRPVSYTHLDVYKRQRPAFRSPMCSTTISPTMHGSA